MSVVLYGERKWYSPYFFSSYVALREKDVPFELRELSLDDGDQRAPDFRDRALTARIPALEHDGFWLAESSAIAEYVDEVFDGPPLLPRDARDRARARQIMAWLRSDLLALREERGTESMFYDHPIAPLTDAGQAAADKLVHVAGLLIADVGRGLFGAWSLPDAELAFMLHRLILAGDPVEGRVRAWAEREWQRPSVQAFVTRPRG